MARQRYLCGRRFWAVLASLAVVGGFLWFLALGTAHTHDDFKSHKDCAVCLWQSFFFSLIHKGITLTHVAAVAFLVPMRLRLDPPTQIIGQTPIRAPPDPKK